MSDIRWYNEDPPAPIDVALWHPYSAPPIHRSGQWNFNTSPSDLFSIGKWLWDKAVGKGGSIGALGPAAAAMATSGVAPSSLGAMLGASGMPELGAGTGALPGFAGALADYIGGTSGTAGASAGVTGGTGMSLGSAGMLSSIAPIAIPTAALALAKILGVGKSNYDPGVALDAQFGSRHPTREAWNEYARDVNARKVPLEYLNAGLHRIGYGPEAEKLLQDYGLLDENHHWTNYARPLVVGNIHSGAPWEEPLPDYSKLYKDKIWGTRPVRNWDLGAVGGA